VIAGAAALALVWVALTGDASPANVALGVAVGALALAMGRPLGKQGFARTRPLRLVGFVAYFVGQLLLANVRVARAVLGPLRSLRPAIVAIPLRVDRDAEITLLASLITLTPGTLSLEVSGDRRTLYVHALGVTDPDALRRDIGAGFERRILEVFR
jgi:multicomponent Na+:H+ antiporter subunit E